MKGVFAVALLFLTFALNAQEFKNLKFENQKFVYEGKAYDALNISWANTGYSIMAKDVADFSYTKTENGLVLTIKKNDGICYEVLMSAVWLVWTGSAGLFYPTIILRGN
jgi:hypothetical protein